MGMLTHRGIEWECIKPNGKIAFVFLKHAIVFKAATNLYHLCEGIETIFADRKASVCLEEAPEFIWEYHSKQFKPSWEQ
jgi:hypothetical protein